MSAGWVKAGSGRGCSLHIKNVTASCRLCPLSPCWILSQDDYQFQYIAQFDKVMVSKTTSIFFVIFLLVVSVALQEVQESLRSYHYFIIYFNILT